MNVQRGFLVVALLAALTLALPGSSGAERYAVLIGIDDYPPAGPHSGHPKDLTTCETDVALMSDLLTGRHGFADDHVVALTSAEATRSAIIEAIETHLIARAKPDDAVVIYYSGHGTAGPDVKGDEEDGGDEALVCAEPGAGAVTSREDIDRCFLSDDVIAALLLRMQTENVTLIFDSCHSGTAQRAPEELRGPQIKQAQVTFPPMMPREARRASREVADNLSETALDSPTDVLFLASSQPWEFSSTGGDWFTFEGDSAQASLFTTYLTRALGEADPSAGWASLLPAIQRDVVARNPGQCPVSEGPVGRRLFETEIVDETAMAWVRPSIGIDSVGEDGVAVLWTAQSVGKVTGADYDVYAPPLPGEPVVSGAPVGRIQVVGYSFPMTFAKVVEGTVVQGSRAVAASVQFEAQAHRIFVSNENPTLSRDFARVVGAAPDASLAFPESSADFVLVPEADADSVKVNIIAGGGAVNSAPFTGATVDEVWASVWAHILKRTTQERLVRLSNPSPPFRVTLGSDRGLRPYYRPGETMRLTALAGEECHLLLLAAREDGSVRLLSIDGTDGPVVYLSPGTSVTASLAMESDGNTIAVKAIATREPIDAAALTEAGDSVEALFAALYAQVGHPENARLLGTDGWSDATVVAVCSELVDWRGWASYRFFRRL